jgi:hypothetical protein
MTKLTNATVYRSGRTARSWTHETDKVEIYDERETVRFRFSLASKGGGITDVKLNIGPDDFSALTAAMIEADRGQAMKHMSAALANAISNQPDEDRCVVRNARKSVIEAAEDAFRAAPDGRDHAERLTRDMVQQLVRELNERDDAQSDDTAA